MRRTALEAAAALLHERGPAGTTMAGLADALGWSVGALYRYFPSKEALVEAVELEQVGRLRRSLKAGQAALSGALQRVDHPEAVRELARVQALAAFWVDAAQHLPREVETARELLLVRRPGATSRQRAARRAHEDLVGPLSDALAAAHPAGVAGPDPRRWRGGVIVGAMLAVTAELDAEGPAVDHRCEAVADTAAVVLDGILESWGATRPLLEAGRDVVRSARHPHHGFAPPPPRAT